MPTEYILDRIGQDLKTVPYHVGVNNHMGSLGTTNVELMKIVLGELKTRGLFFLDSQTTTDSVAYEVAVQLGVPALKRDVFFG